MDTLLTWECKAMAAPRVVAELANLTGLDLRCDPSLEDEVLLVRIQDVPVQTLLEKVESSIRGKWKKTGEAWTLSAQPEPIRADVYTDRLKTIQDAQAGFLVPLADYGTEDDTRREAKESDDLDELSWDESRVLTIAEIESISKAALRNPSFIFCNDMFRRLDARILAGLGIEERAVFATKPNSRQHPIADPDEFKRAIQLFAERAKIWGEYEGKSWAIKENETQIESYTSRYGAFLASLTEFLVIVSRLETEGRDEKFSVDVHSLDRANTVQHRDFVFLSRNDPDHLKKLDDLSRSLPALGRVEESFTLSPDALLVHKNSMQVPVGNEETDRQLLNLLKSPLEKDILSYGASETLFALLKSESANAVLCIPDEWVAIAGPIPVETDGVVPLRSVQEYNSEIARTAGKLLRVENGWLVIMPTGLQQPSVPAQRASRRSLQQAIDEGFKADPDLIRARCLLMALNVPLHQLYKFTYPYYKALGLCDSTFNLGYDKALARFILSLTPAEYNGLKSGAPVYYGSLSDEAREHFDSLVFGFRGRVETVPAEEDVSGEVYFKVPFSRGVVELEPTIAVEGGIRADTEIRFQRSADFALRMYSASKDEENARDVAIQDLVYWELQNEQGSGNEVFTVPEFYRLLAGGSTFLSADLVPGKARLRRFLVRTKFRPTGAFMRKEELPPHVLKLWNEIKIRKRETLSGK